MQKYVPLTIDMATTKTTATSQRSVLKPLFYAAFGLLLGVVIWQQRQAFGDSLSQLSEVNMWWVVAGFAALMLSVLASAAVYYSLSPKKLNYPETVLVQTAGLGLNRLLPAGSGALGVSYLYLRANKLSKTLSAAVAAGNNLVGFVGHALLVILTLMLWPNVLGQFSGFSLSNIWLFVVGAVAIVMAVGVVWILSRRSKLLKSLQPLFARPERLFYAVLWSSLITLSYATAVILSAQAIGYNLSLPAALIVLSFGVAATAAVPVPGGVGAAEAGMFLALHSLGLNDADALAVAILYRVMTFWLPLIVGGVALLVVSRRNLLRKK